MNEVLVKEVQARCIKGDSRGVLQLFEDYPEHFSCIPLPDSDVDPSQAISDIVRENVILNGVPFFGNGELLLQSLERVVEILAQGIGAEPSVIVERILCKASRTTSGSDSYFTIEQLFGNSGNDYLLKPRGDALPPMEIEVFVVDKVLHSTISCVNYYGLYSMQEIDKASQSFRLSQPSSWMSLDTTVVEKTDYMTGRNVRYLRVIATEPERKMTSPSAVDSGDGPLGATFKLLQYFPGIGGTGGENGVSPRLLVEGSLKNWKRPLAKGAAALSVGISPEPRTPGLFSSCPLLPVSQEPCFLYFKSPRGLKAGVPQWGGPRLSLRSCRSDQDNQDRRSLPAVAAHAG
ncbi:unnamed protein product [Chrysoparadoxa australica]